MLTAFINWLGVYEGPVDADLMVGRLDLLDGVTA